MQKGKTCVGSCFFPGLDHSLFCCLGFQGKTVAFENEKKKPNSGCLRMKTRNFTMIS